MQNSAARAKRFLVAASLGGLFYGVLLRILRGRHWVPDYATFAAFAVTVLLAAVLALGLPGRRR